jgi:hypothetical protein
MPDFFQGLVDPTSGIDLTSDTDSVPWTVLLAPSGPFRTELGHFPGERAGERERERRELAVTGDPWERAAYRLRASVKAGGRDDGASTTNRAPVESLFPRQAELRNWDQSLRERMAGGIADLLHAAGASNYRANKLGYGLTDVASLLPPIGIPIAVDEFKRAAERGDVPEAVLAAAGATPPGRAGGRAARSLPMGEASRMGRAVKLGYLDEPFYRGERSGETPTAFGPNTFFSRNRQYADGFAQVGGKEAADEYRLAIKDPFRFYEPVTAHSYGRLVRQVYKENLERAATMVDMIAPGKSIAWFEQFVRKNPNEIVASKGGDVYQLVKGDRREAFETFKKAGFDALDTGRDVIKFTSHGIRSKNAAFDPKRARSKNIMAGGLPPLAAGAVLAQDRGEDWSPDGPSER